MKKIKIIAVLLTVIVLCSACTGKNTTIKFEKFPVKHQDDTLVEVFNLTTPVDKKEIDGLFALTERKAAILSVIPEKYDVILEIDEDNHKKVYPVVTCQIKAVSSEYNMIDIHPDEKIVIKQKETNLIPKNENVIKKILKEIETINNGQLQPGQYIMPAKFVNNTYFDILYTYSETSLCLMLNEEYYIALLMDNNTGDYGLRHICPKADNELNECFDVAKEWFDKDKIQKINSFKEFIKEYCSDIT